MPEYLFVPKRRLKGSSIPVPLQYKLWLQIRQDFKDLDPLNFHMPTELYQDLFQGPPHTPGEDPQLVLIQFI